MTRLIDLTLTLDPDNRAKLPPPLAGAAKVVAPQIEYAHPAKKGAEEFCRYLGCTHDDLPDGEGWGEETLSDMSSHCGTHVDAPLHSGSRIAGLLARTITDIPLEELYRPGIVLDVRPWAKHNEEITIEMLDAALAATGTTIKQGDAVLIRTGQERYTMTDPLFYQQPGMSRASTLHLTRQGATILGTDAVVIRRHGAQVSADPRQVGFVGRTQSHCGTRSLHRAADDQLRRAAFEWLHGGLLPLEAGPLQCGTGTRCGLCELRS